MVVEDSTKTTRTLWICIPISMTLVLVLNGCFLEKAITNISCDDIGGTVKLHVAKWSLQRPLDNQILDYKAMLDLCENEMMSIKFFGIWKERWSVLKILRLKMIWSWGHLSVTQSSHHLVPLLSSRIGDKLTS